MNDKRRIPKISFTLLGGLVLVLLSVGVVLAGGSIDPTNKWAWGANTGWLNLAPDNGGVTVYSDHLEGYAWGENIGWLRLGTCTGGNPCTYANDATNTYGVNNDGVGNLSGYAWGANVGWINFAPDYGGVWVDPVTGDFEGYAWGENVGWIHFQNASPAYKVQTGWHGNLRDYYESDIAAIITTRRPGPASSGGLSIADHSFLNDVGDGIIFGHDNAAFANVTDHLPAGVDKRWARLWQVDVNDGVSTKGGDVTLTFDISEAGGQGDFSETGTYYLLEREIGSSYTFTTVIVTDASVSGDQLTFTVDIGNLGSEFTLGATADSPTAVALQSQAAGGGGFVLIGGAVLGGLLVLGVMTVVLRRKRQG
jgi:hypothetical protein